MTVELRSAAVRPPLTGIAAWWWAVGVVRVFTILLIAAGTYLLADIEPGEGAYLALFYVFGLACGVGYLIAVREAGPVRPLLSWAQILADFCVVAATVSFTGGRHSLFASLFVIVILEGGIILGVVQGFAVATLASAVMVVIVWITPAQSVGIPEPAYWFNEGALSIWYGLLIYVLGFYLTAAVCGFWNYQVWRLQRFQREILDNMNNGFLITDCAGIISVVNKAAERILNLSESQAVGRPVQEVLRVESGEECPVLTALRSERDFTRYEYIGLAFPNTPKLLGLSTSRIYDWRGRMTGIIASFSDLTELEQMRDEIKRQDRLSVVGELAAGLAHEIRNPVAAIRGAVDELASSIAPDPLAGRLINIALRESDQLNAIVSNFLDFARKPRVHRDVFDVCGLVREVIDSLHHKFGRQNGLLIEGRFPEAACPVSGDRSQIKQVFVNLAKNAIEAMDGHGALQVVVTRGASSVEIRFDDEGPGIEPDKVARIFEPFFTTKESGVGMGLAISLRIVTAHDGTIRAASREGGGASMSVRLPLAREREER